MSTVLGRLRGFWRDHINGPRLRTYEDACDELGGVPWRAAQDTDRWFRPDTLSQRLPSVEKLPLLDTAAISLKRTMSDGTKLVLLGGSALVVIIACVISLAGGAHAAQPTKVAMLTAPAPSATPASATTATTTAPANAAPAPAGAAPAPVSAPAFAAAPRSSSSVQALFAAHPKAAAKKHSAARRRHR